MAKTAAHSEQQLTISDLRSLLRYEPETGKLYWLPRDASLFNSARLASMFRTQFEGKEAFRAVGVNGYRIGVLLGVPVISHRVIWAIVHGKWPDEQIDHINGNRADNRIHNLRAVSHTDNHRNRKMPSNNTSGAVGVCWAAAKNKWQAFIIVNKRYKTLGRFSDFEDALKARKAAEVEYGFHPNHGR